MEDRPRFASREEYEAWKQARPGGGYSATGTLDPPGELPTPPPRPSFHHQPERPAAKESGRIYELAAGVLVLAVVAGIAIWWLGYQDSSADPRFRIEAPAKMRVEIKKFVNRSPFWEAYLDHVAPSAAQPVVALSLTTERHTQKSYGGDYDPGTVEITFAVVQLSSDVTLYERDARVELEPFMIGRFEDATREQIQEAAFQATEQKVMPYMDRWVDLAGIRAMAASGSSRFVPLLEETVADKWTPDDVSAEARKALRAIRGAS